MDGRAGADTRVARPRRSRSRVWTACSRLRSRAGSSIASGLWRLCVMAALIAAAAVIHRSPQIYSASAVVRLERSEKTTRPSAANPQLESQRLNLIREGVVSRPVLQRLIEANGLCKLLARPDEPQLSKESAITAARGMIQVRARPGTDLIEVSVEHSSPAVCEKLANAVVQEYNAIRNRRARPCPASATN